MHSTETTVLKLLSDILLALDSDNVVMLTLLDLSAAFDSVDHDKLLKRLHTSYGLGGQVSLHTFVAVRNTAGISSRADSLPSVLCRSTAACDMPSANSSRIR